MMTQIGSVQEDLHYVKQAVQRRERQGAMPLGIAIYWGLATLIGFGLADFAPARTGLFWLIVGPLGFVVSTWIGSREARVTGDADRATGMRIVWHWAGMMGAILLSSLLVSSGEVTGSGLGRVVLLILALAYFLAGIHFERSLTWISLLLVAGFVALGYIHNYVWTVTGVLLCVALLASALGGRRHGQA